MSRAYPFAVVYMLTNAVTGMIYISETVDLVSRMSHYRGTWRRNAKYNNAPISQAILQYGWDAFTTTILVSERDDPRIKDVVWRRRCERYFIEKYDSTNPNIGYNVIDDMTNFRMRKRGEPGIPHKKETKIMKSDPILAYNVKDKSVMMYLGAQSAAELLGISDRSMIIRSTKTGYILHDHYFFKVDYGARYKRAVEYFKDKAWAYHPTDQILRRVISKTKNAVERYMVAARAIDDYCREFGYRPTEIDKVRKMCIDG